MKNTKILIILTATWFFAIGVDAQGKTAPLNFFVPREKGVYKKISAKVIVTKAKFGLREYPDEIYFSDSKGNLKNKIKIFPGNIGNPNKVSISSSEKYLGIYRNYRAKKPNAANGVLREDFIVLDSTGSVLWETKGDSLKHVFFNDDSDAVFLLDPYSGILDEYTVYGKFLGKKNYSEWMENYSAGEESPIISKSLVSEGGKYVALSRIAAGKQVFYELTLLSSNGTAIFQKDIKKLAGWVSFISTSKKVVVVLESDYKYNRKADEKKIKQYAGYDFNGNLLWVQGEDNISFEGRFLDDGSDYIFSNDKARMDLATGKITR